MILKVSIKKSNNILSNINYPDNKMNNPVTNLFIVDSDKVMVSGLKQYLNDRFGKNLLISSFYTGESCLEKIDKNTDFVILAYYLNGSTGNDVLRSIKKINSKTEVIMLSSNENVGIAIDAFRSGAKDFIIKGQNDRKKIASRLQNIFMYPVRVLVKEFAISKYLAMFLLTFVTMGILVAIILKQGR